MNREVMPTRRRLQTPKSPDPADAARMMRVDISKNSRDRSIGRAVIILFLIASFVAVDYVILHQIGGANGVASQTNDEIEVVPS